MYNIDLDMDVSISDRETNHPCKWTIGWGFTCALKHPDDLTSI